MDLPVQTVRHASSFQSGVRGSYVEFRQFVATAKPRSGIRQGERLALSRADHGAKDVARAIEQYRAYGMCVLSRLATDLVVAPIRVGGALGHPYRCEHLSGVEGSFEGTAHV